MVSSETPQISVIIYSYNFEKYLEESIESILAQTLRPYEIIICDDHSTDKSWDIICKYRKNYPELISAYRHNTNIGMTANGNFGFKLIKGELISWLDGDDRWLPKKLELEWRTLKKNPAAKIAYSNVCIINSSGQKTRIWDNGKNPGPPSGDAFVQVFSKDFFPNSTSVFRNHLMYCSLFDEIGYLDEQLEIFIDWDLKIRATAKFPLIYTNEPLVEYRLHEKGIHNSSLKIRYKDILKIFQKNKNLLSNRTNDEINIVKNGIKKKLDELIPEEKLNLNFSAEEESILSDLGFKNIGKIPNIKSNYNTGYVICAESMDQKLNSTYLKQSEKAGKRKASHNVRTIAHVVNPVFVPEESDLYYAQPITFETMRRAKESALDTIDVTLYSAHYPEDKKMVSDYFVSLESLTRSVMDVGQFGKQRKLPLITDILDRLYESSDAEYLIYTNSDISLKPNFYSAVDEIIHQGYDAFIINRRTIPNTYRKIDEIPLMYEEIGEPHPGYDCFIFKRDIYPKFRLRNICIGINYVGLALLKNLECHANKFKVFDDLHFTFHIGNDKPWKKDEYEDYRKHNELEYHKALEDLDKEFGFDHVANIRAVTDSKNEIENHFQIKIVEPEILKQVREKNIFFVLSTGRSGTKTIAESLSGLPDCLCLHEPAPQLILESSAYRYGRLEDERLRQFLLQTRQPVVNGKVYGESNQTLSLIVPVLAKSFPTAKFIWLIRNGLDVVSSIFARQWYTGHSANHDRYEDCPPLEKAWIDGRIMGDLCGDVPLAKWKKMNPFARCCWYWAYINRIIEKDLSDHCQVGNYQKLKLEELDQSLPEISAWLGFGQTLKQKTGRHNQAHYKLYPWQKWTLEERKTFLYWCGPLMDKLYPDWRILNQGFFDNLDNTPKNLKASVERYPKNQRKLNEDNSGKVKSEELNIYFTPQIKTLPKISVYITSYNQKRYLIEAIESVLTQSLKPHEIIIVDDCSNDDSQELIAKYTQKYPNLIFPIYHTKNFGVVQTRLDALNAVTGDFVTYVDGDDRFLPEKLEREFEILAGNPKAQIAFSNNYYINPAGQPIGRWVEEEKPPQGFIFKETFGRIFPKNSLFRMELVNYQAWKAVGFHDPAITIYEDFDMRIRMTKHFQAAFCDEPLSEIRMHDKGLSKLEAKQHLASLEFIYHKNRYLLDDLDESDREIVKNGFYDFVNNISRVAAKQLSEKHIRKKQNSDKPLHDAISTRSKKGQVSGQNELGSNLIFLISQPRAGSTLFQRVLAGHPEIHTMAEPWIMLHPLYALKENGIIADYRADLAQQGLVDFLAQVPEGIELYKTALRKFGSTLYNRALELSEKRFFLDKTPRYYHIIPELFSIFPEANFIFLLRNPIAVLSSVLKTWYGNRVAGLQIQTLIDLIKGPVRLLDGIKKLNEKAIVVEYESFVQSSETVMLRVCNRLGIPYYEDMLDYGQKPKPKGRFGDSVGIYEHQRPVADNIDKWLKNITSPELVEFSNQYLKALGSDIVSKMGYNFNELNQKLNSERPIGNTLQPNLNKLKIFNKEGENLYVLNAEDQNGTHQQKYRKKDSDPEEAVPLTSVTEKNSAEKFIISAIVSTYNSERFIKGCLEDLENQTIADKLEIIALLTAARNKTKRRL
jgi:glycosyltransferase involved in cell wall biosynthesis